MLFFLTVKNIAFLLLLPPKYFEFMKFTVLIITFFISISVFSQTRIDSIYERLPQGALLVRLSTKDHLIKALKGKNDTLLQKVIRKRDARNAEIVEAFKTFTYCPVYFFYASDSKKIIARNFTNVLLDFNLNRITDSVILFENYLIAEFSYTRKANGKIYMGDKYRYVWREVDGKYQAERKFVPTYGSASAFNSGIDALILLSPELVPLQKYGTVKANSNNNAQSSDSSIVQASDNFSITTRLMDPTNFVTFYPHYVRTFERFPFIIRSKQRTVELLQLKIQSYIAKNLKH